MRTPTPRLTRWLLLLLLAAVFGASCAKGYPGESEVPEEEEPERIPTEIVVAGIVDSYSAGTIVRGECLVIDQFGEPMEAAAGATPRVDIQPTHLFEGSGRELRAAIVGEAYATCSLAAYGLYSVERPFEIVPGPAVRSVIVADETRMMAGESMGATCHVFDAYGNTVDAEGEVELHAMPQNAGNQIDGLNFYATRADLYNLTCELPGLETAEHDVLRVDPGLPYSMSVGLRPNRASFRVFDHTLLDTIVQDRFGNRISGASLAYHSETIAHGATAENFGNRFSFESDGVVRLHARVTSALDAEVSEVSGYVDVTVNTGGPGIRCYDTSGDPNDAYFAQMSGNARNVRVEVIDDFEVVSVRVNGIAATNAGGEDWSATIGADWGHNFVNVVATDEHGEENSGYCFVLASDNWGAANSSAVTPGLVSLSLGQPALYPRTSGPALDTFAQILDTVLNSQGLRDMMEQMLRDASPFADGWYGRLIYLNNSLNFNASTRLYAHNSGGVQGLQLQLTLTNFRAGVGYRSWLLNPDGIVSASSATVTANVGISVDDGNLRTSLSGTSLSIDNLRLNIGGIGGSIISALVNLVLPLFRGLIERELAKLVQDQVGPLLSGMVESLDIGELLPEFDIPRLDADRWPAAHDHVTLRFNKAFSDFRAVHRQRATFGLGTSFQPHHGDGVARQTLGVPFKSGNYFWDKAAQPNSPVTVAIHEGLINQVLHALWMTGYFNIEMSLGDGYAAIDAKLPPTVHFEGGRLHVALGGVDATIDLPPLLTDPPFSIQFGGRLSASASIVGNELVVGTLTMNPATDLAINFEDSVSDAARQVLEQVVGDILVNVLGTTLNEALPPLPIPEFELPADFLSYFPGTDGRISLMNGLIEFDSPHIALRGKIGVQ